MHEISIGDATFKVRLDPNMPPDRIRFEQPCQDTHTANCPVQPTRQYAIGCIHEHLIDPRWLCAEHAAKTESCCECIPCYDAGHACKLTTFPITQKR